MTEEESKWIKTNDSVCALLKQAHDVLAMSSLPPKREWVGLTDEELHQICNSLDYYGDRELVQLIEAKLKEKNA